MHHRVAIPGSYILLLDSHNSLTVRFINNNYLDNVGEKHAQG